MKKEVVTPGHNHMNAEVANIQPLNFFG